MPCEVWVVDDGHVERPTPPGPGGSTGAPPEGQLEVLLLLGLQPDTGGLGPAPQPWVQGNRTGFAGPERFQCQASDQFLRGANFALMLRSEERRVGKEFRP